jgi:hypothetical protein
LYLSYLYKQKTGHDIQYTEREGIVVYLAVAKWVDSEEQLYLFFDCVLETVAKYPSNMEGLLTNLLETQLNPTTMAYVNYFKKLLNKDGILDA